MKYLLDLNDRPFKAIKAGTKTVEGRTPTPHNKLACDKLQAGETIHFINNVTNEEMDVEITFVHHYPNVKEMLETEGPENVLSGNPKTVEHGIKSYNLLEEYKDAIIKNGIYAIGVKPI